MTNMHQSVHLYTYPKQSITHNAPQNKQSAKHITKKSRNQTMNSPLATYTMTMPTTTNHIRASYKGRLITSKAYRIWQQNTAIDLFGQKKHATITQDIFLSVKLSPKTKAKTDIDNRNKGIFDALVASGIITDDSQVKKLLIEFDYTKKDFVSVEIYAYTPNIQN